MQPALSRRGCCDATVCYHSDSTLIVHSQALSSMRASPRLGCAIYVPRDPALNASVTHGRTAPLASIECCSIPGHQSTASDINVTSTPTCLYPVSGPLAVLDIGAVVPGRRSDRGPRRDATTATLPHSGIHRYGVVVGARPCGDASEWRCVMLVGLRRLARVCERCVLWVCRDVV